MEGSHQPEKEQAVDRAVPVLFRAIVANARANRAEAPREIQAERAALVQARRKFLAIAAQVGPTFRHRLISAAVEQLIEDLPKATPDMAERAVRNDCIRLFGRDLCWCDLGALDAEGSA